MAIITTDNQHYSDIAAAIRGKNGLTTQYKPAEMAAAITALPTGGGSGGDYELEKILYSPTSQSQMSNFNFTDYDYLVVIPILTATTNIFSFKVPEIGVTENIMPIGMYNSSYTRFELYTNQAYPISVKLEDATTAKVYMPSFGTLQPTNFFPTTGSNKAIVFGLKKVSSISAARARKRTPANLIREEGNIIPLIINEDMTEEDIIALFYGLEETEYQDNIYIVNNPFVTQELIEVVENKKYNVIQV